MANEVSSIFGNPNVAPNNGIMNVRKEIGIRCFKLRFTSNISEEIFRTKNGGTRTIVRKLIIAAGRDPKRISSGINSSTIINNAIIAPFAEPDSRIFLGPIKPTISPDDITVKGESEH